MTSTFSPNKSLELPASGDYVNTWATPVNADWTAIDTSFGGLTSINVVSASGTIVLSVDQYRPPNIVISGLLTANVNYQLPSGVGGTWSIFNNTTGAFSVTFSSAGGGTAVALMQGSRTLVLCDGTNVAVSVSAVGALTANGQLIGGGTTAADNAAAGQIGEFLSTPFTSGALSSGVITQVAVLVLTAGDWDLWSQINFIVNGATLSTIISNAGLVPSSTSSTYYVAALQASFTAASNQSFFVGQNRVSVSGNTNIYANAQASYSGGSGVTTTGIIAARRAR